MVQTRQKVFRIVPKMSQVVPKFPKIPTSDASLSERTCLSRCHILMAHECVCAHDETSIRTFLLPVDQQLLRMQRI